MTTVLVQYAHGVLISGRDSTVQYTAPLPSFNPPIESLPANPLAPVEVNGAPTPEAPMESSNTIVPPVTPAPGPTVPEDGKEAPTVSEEAQETKDAAEPEAKDAPTETVVDEKAE